MRENITEYGFLLGMSVVLAQEILGVTLRSGEGKSRHLSRRRAVSPTLNPQLSRACLILLMPPS